MIDQATINQRLKECFYQDFKVERERQAMNDNPKFSDMTSDKRFAALWDKVMDNPDEATNDELILISRGQAYRRMSAERNSTWARTFRQLFEFLHYHEKYIPERADDVLDRLVRKDSYLAGDLGVENRKLDLVRKMLDDRRTPSPAKEKEAEAEQQPLLT